MAKVFSYPVTIRESHIDTFGHVNNATYLALYEEARWELLNHGGYGMKEIQIAKQGPVILEVNVKFIKEIHVREKITITTETVSANGKVSQLRQTMVKENGDLASEAIFTYGLFDLKQRKLIEMTPAWKKAVGLDE